MAKNSASDDREKIRVPAPILTIVHLILAILLRRVLPLPVPMPIFVPWLGLGLATVGFLLGMLALNEFKRNRAISDPKKPATGFVTSGIYRYTRNPVYLGFVFILIGFTLSMGSYWGIILTWPLIILMNDLVIKPEEVNLERRYQSQYLEYNSKVRRWL